MNRIEFDKLTIKEQVEYVNSQLDQKLSLRKISEDIDIQRKSIRIRFRKAGFEFNQQSNKYIYLDEINEKILEEYKPNTDVITEKETGALVEYKRNTIVIKNKTSNKTSNKNIIKDNEYKENTNVVVGEQNKINEKSKPNTDGIIDKEAGALEEYKQNTIVLEDNIKKDLLSIAEAKEDIFTVIEWVKKQQLEEKIIDIPELKIEIDKFKDDVKVTTIRLYSNIKDQFQEFIKKYPEYKTQDIYSQALLEFMGKYKK
ncbi:hypothetical protein G9F73_019625 [Clostridium estertheticum]|uniref:hypothetical protein n=1 Tax=Clostridium estertheticum TaxID=238834 RepID=UPI0013EE595D|nr:hypothetical protein [Clostridium estertheticum]MBZ9609937.1 hypothetical protein [Clostridium estertheticum]